MSATPKSAAAMLPARLYALPLKSVDQLRRAVGPWVASSKMCIRDSHTVERDKDVFLADGLLPGSAVFLSEERQTAHKAVKQ